MRIICVAKLCASKRAGSFIPLFMSCSLGGGFNEIKILNHLLVLPRGAVEPFTRVSRKQSRDVIIILRESGKFITTETVISFIRYQLRGGFSARCFHIQSIQ